MSCGCSECNKKYGGIQRPPLSYKAGGKSPKASMSCGQVKRSTRPGKKIMKLYCIDGKKKLVHAGAKGYGHNYSAAARKSFKARHKCSTAKPGTAKHLACTELWAGKGGSKKSSPKGRKGKYAEGGPYSVPPDLFSETLATQQAPKQPLIAPATPLMNFSMDSSAPSPSIFNPGVQGPSSLAEVPNSVMYSRGPRGVNFTIQTGMKGKTPTYTTIPFSALQNSLNDPSFFTGDDAGYYREFAIKQLQKGMPLTLDEKGRASIPFTPAQKRAFLGPSEEQYDETLSSEEYLQAFLNQVEDPGALKQTKYKLAKVGPRTGGTEVTLLNLPKISPCPPGTLHCPGFAAGGYRNNYAVGGPYLNINPYNPLNESNFDVLYKNKSQGEMDLSGRQQRRIKRRQTGRNIGATAYGVLEGLVDTLTFGATDAITDKGYEALAGLGRGQSESRRKQSDRYRVGVGQTIGGTTGAILTGGAATGSAISTTDWGTLANEESQALQTGLNIAGTIAGVAVGNTSGIEGTTGGALEGTAVGDISAKLSQNSSFGGTGTGFENLAQTYAPNLKEGISSFQDFKEQYPESNLGDFLKQNPEILQKALEGLGMGSGVQVNKYGGPISYRAGGRRYQTGGPTDPPKDDVLHMGNAADYFNSRAVISDNPRANALIRQKVYAGTHGYNPETGALVKLDTPVKVDPATQAMATEEYTRATAGTRGGITDARTDAYLESLPEDQRQAVEDRFQEQRRQGVERELGKMYQNPITYLPGAVATLPFTGPAAGAMATAGRTALTAPLTIGSRTIPYVTAGDVIGAGFGARGAYNLGTDLDSGFYTDANIPTSQKVERGLITGLDLLGTPGMGSAFYQTGRGIYNTGRQGLSTAQRAGFLTPNVPLSTTGGSGYLSSTFLPGATPRSAPKVKPFQSEIFWGAWNKDIPKYPELIQEYNAIEEATKKAGTWMKNADGTPFQGPPELFIQTQSRNFKKAFPEGYNTVYRGTRGRNTLPTTTSFDRETGKSTSALFSADEALARTYSTSTKPEEMPFITPFMAYRNLEGQGFSPGVFKLAVPKVGNKNLSFPANRDAWTEVALAGKNRATLEADLAQQKSMYNRMLKDPDFNKNYSFGNPLAQKQQQIAELEAALNNPQGIVSNVPEFQKMREALGDVTTTDRIAEYLETTNLPSIQLRNVNDGGLGDVTIINRAPGMYPKSLIGNVGFFNMRNPDVFKAAIPVVGGAAGYGLLQNSEFKGGGYQGGLRRWFKEKWVDVKTGKPCGRSGKEKSTRAYPYCRPSRKVSSKTPATSKHSEAKSRAKQKTGPSRVKPISQRKRK